MKKLSITFAFGFGIGMAIDFTTGYNIINWQWWALVLPMACVVAWYTNGLPD